MQTQLEAVFFDLDGTILDTAHDLADACNQLLQEHNRPAAPFDEFRQWIHGGAAMMISQSFQIDHNHPDFSALKSAFLQNYQQRLTDKTQLFPGIDTVLHHLEQQHIPWGVVTNKYAQFTQPLMTHFGLTHRCCCIISGDSLPTTKPHPAPLLRACELADAKPARCIYVGDTLSDVQAAKAAGMQSIAVRYGYHPKNSKIEEWQADAVASTPDDLLLLFQEWEKGLDRRSGHRFESPGLLRFALNDSDSSQ